MRLVESYFTRAQKVQAELTKQIKEKKDNLADLLQEDEPDIGANDLLALANVCALIREHEIARELTGEGDSLVDWAHFNDRRNELIGICKRGIMDSLAKCDGSQDKCYYEACCKLIKKVLGGQKADKFVCDAKSNEHLYAAQQEAIGAIKPLLDEGRGLEYMIPAYNKWQPEKLKDRFDDDNQASRLAKKDLLCNLDALANEIDTKVSSVLVDSLPLEKDLALAEQWFKLRASNEYDAEKYARLIAQKRLEIYQKDATRCQSWCKLCGDDCFADYVDSEGHLITTKRNEILLTCHLHEFFGLYNQLCKYKQSDYVFTFTHDSGMEEKITLKGAYEALDLAAMDTTLENIRNRLKCWSDILDRIKSGSAYEAWQESLYRKEKKFSAMIEKKLH